MLVETANPTTFYSCIPPKNCLYPQRAWRIGLLLFLAALFSISATGQDPVEQAVSVKALGISYHLLKSQSPALYPNRLDPEGVWVVNYGAIAGYERFLKPGLSIRLEQGGYADCSGLFGGFSHLGFRARFFKTDRHELIGGIGPTLVYRQDWNRLDGYRDDGYFARHRNWQYRFFWYAGELEYYYQITPTKQIGFTLVPGLPELLLLGLGYRVSY